MVPVALVDRQVVSGAVGLLAVLFGARKSGSCGVLGDAAFVGGDRQAAGTGSARRAADERVSQHYSGDWD
jgi:hypothetical protein